MVWERTTKGSTGGPQKQNETDNENLNKSSEEE
jgi:hypothetical protein